MTVLDSSLDTSSPEYTANAEAMAALVADLRAKVAVIETGGGEAARDRHVGRGKMLPRERIAALIDPGSPFLEFSQLAAYEVYEDPTPAAGRGTYSPPRRHDSFRASLEMKEKKHAQARPRRPASRRRNCLPVDDPDGADPLAVAGDALRLRSLGQA